jgi:predicted metal-dependent HD superfamily phosphohydrolase
MPRYLPVSEETRLKLEALYSEGHRRYHNAHHINGMLKTLYRVEKLIDPDVLARAAIDLKVVEAAVLFHDAIYDSHAGVESGSNEKRSAQVFRESPEFKTIGSYRAYMVETAIIASTYHTQWLPNHTPTTHLFMDLDLAGMGMGYFLFLEHGKMIREEYSWVGQEEFMTARRKFFLELSKRPFLFYNQVMRGMFEENARANIQRWLDRPE